MVQLAETGIPGTMGHLQYTKGKSPLINSHRINRPTVQ